MTDCVLKASHPELGDVGRCRAVMRPPFAIRVVGKTDSTNLRLHWHRGEVIFNWECNVRELRVHDPATGEQHAINDEGFLATNICDEIGWEIAPRQRSGHGEDLAAVDSRVALKLARLFTAE